VYAYTQVTGAFYSSLSKSTGGLGGKSGGVGGMGEGGGKKLIVDKPKAATEFPGQGKA
jgi:hypothetical protein